MPGFRCVPIPTETAERFRRGGLDDAGNALRRMVSTGVGFPCRHCLRGAAEGEAVLLGSYRLPHPQGIYWTPSPIFIHAGPCERFSETDVIAPIVRPSLVSLRAYDEAEQCLYDLGHAGEGDAIDTPLARAVADPRTAFINIHTAKPGCLLCAVERVADQPR